MDSELNKFIYSKHEYISLRQNIKFDQKSILKTPKYLFEAY